MTDFKKKIDLETAKKITTDYQYAQDFANTLLHEKYPNIEHSLKNEHGYLVYTPESQKLFTECLTEIFNYVAQFQLTDVEWVNNSELEQLKTDCAVLEYETEFTKTRYGVIEAVFIWYNNGSQAAFIHHKRSASKQYLKINMDIGDLFSAIRELRFNDKLIQNVLPKLSSNMREYFMTGNIISHNLFTLLANS